MKKIIKTIIAAAVLSSVLFSAACAPLWKRTPDKEFAADGTIVNGEIRQFDVTNYTHSSREGRIVNGTLYEKPCVIMDNSCDSLEISFFGDYFIGDFSSSGDVYIRCEIDGELSPSVLVKEGEITLASGLEKTNHTIKIIKITELYLGKLYVLGFKCEKFLAPNDKKDLRISFYGDSITCGYGNIGSSSSHDLYANEQDAVQAYPYLVAKELNARMEVVAESGWALGVSKWGNNSYPRSIPDVFDRVSTGNKTAWDNTLFNADVIVVNLGTNDRTSTAAERTSLKKNTQKFIAALREKYTHSIIIFTLDLMDSTDASIIIDQTISEENKEDVYFLSLMSARERSTGSNGHPNVKSHKKASEILVGFIKEKLTQKKYL